MLNLYLDRGQFSDKMKILELGCGEVDPTYGPKYPNSQITGVSNSNDQRIFIKAKCEKKVLKM